VPFFVLVKDNKVLSRMSGANPPSLNNALQMHASGSSLPPVQETSAKAPAVVEQPVEDLNTRLGKLVKAAPVMLFMKGTPSAPQCGFSRKLVGILREKNVRYGFFNILADDDVRQGLKTFSDWPTYRRGGLH
jgi:Glutaredoxin